jgi:flagellar protein FlaG
MDTSNLTLAPSAGHKTRPGSSPAVAAEAASQGAKAAAPDPVEKAVKEVAASAEAESFSQPVATSGGEATQNQNLVQDTLRKLNDLSQTSIAFSQHEETGRTVITVSDKESGEEIRTIPSEDLLAIASHLEEALSSSEGLQPGMLVSSKA